MDRNPAIAFTVGAVVLAATIAWGTQTGWKEGMTFTNHDLRVGPVPAITAYDDGDGTWSTVREVVCTFRGTIASGSESSPNDLNASDCPDDSSEDQFNRVIIRGIGLSNSGTGLCISINGGTDYHTIDGEAPIWDSNGRNVTGVLVSNDSNCSVWDGSTGRSFEIELD